MAKNNFLLVDLSEKKTKKLAETITSDTSRKILNFLVEKDDTEANISKELQIPISTVHYHLQKLKEAGLVVVEEFHYSKKGREVNHYKLANKYIIIAPKKISGLKEKLKGILPVALASVGIAAVIKIFTSFTSKISGFEGATKTVAANVLMDAIPVVEEAELAVPIATEVMNCLPQSSPNYALWFLVGSMSAIIIYLIVMMIKERIKK
jgi:DNA-binding transcriptional ArsR family regulator